MAFDSLSLVGGNAFGGGYPYQSNRFAIVSALPVPQVVWSASSPQPFNQGDRNTYYAFASDFQSPRTYSWQVALEQGLGHAQRLSVTYVGAAGRELPYFYAENPYIRDTDTVGIARVNAFSNDGRSDSNALMAEYAWRLSHGLQVQVNYTWSHALDLDSGELVQTNASAPPNLIDPLLNRASADFDRRHVFLTTASYQLPVLGDGGVLGKLGSDWQFDTAVVYQSGAPINITSARDIGVGSGLYRPDMVSDVPPWIFDESSPGGRSLNSAAFAVPLEQRQGTLGRNTFQAFPLRQVDLSLSRSFRLGERVSARVRIDAFNVLNLANFGPPIASLDRQSDFGRAFQSYANALGTGTLYGGGLVPIQQKGGPRSVQIGVRFAF